MTPADIARAMGGRVDHGAALVPGPGHSAADRSLSVKVDSRAPDGFIVHSFSGDDPIMCRDYVRQKLGMPVWQPTHGRNGHQRPINRVTSAPAQITSFPPRTPPDENGKPRFFQWDAPPRQQDELRRHVYRRHDSEPVRIKVKQSRDPAYLNWFRVRDLDGTLGWQARKPEGFQPVAYIGAVDPFDPELKDSPAYWTEGEKDADTAGSNNLPAFTFGGCGDGLPGGIEHLLAGRHLIICADNDEPGCEHAEKKAARAHGAGAASIRILNFPELPVHGDLTDYFARGGSGIELEQRAEAAQLWRPHVEAPPIALVSTRASDITPERIEWIWPGRIAVGKLTLIAGKPGLGKSQLSTSIAATVTNGDRWPCDEGRAPKGTVVIFSAEDGVADTIIPRLMAVGANRSRVEIVSGVTEHEKGRRTFNLKADIGLLEAKVRQLGNVSLIIVDPISAYLGGIDGNGNVETRVVLEPLADMASRLRIAVLAITHLNKGSAGNQNAMERFAGSIAFVAAARAAFIVTEDEENEGQLLFLQVKNNIAPKQKGLGFRLVQHIVEDDIVASSIVWHGQHVERTADEALAATEGRGEGQSTKDEIADFLRAALAGGPVPVPDLECEARAAGVLGDGQRIGHNKALQSASKALGVVKKREGFGAGASYKWSLPDLAASPCAPENHHVRHVHPPLKQGAHGAHEGAHGVDDLPVAEEMSPPAAPKMPSDAYDAPLLEQGTLGNSGHLRDQDGSADQGNSR